MKIAIDTLNGGWNAIVIQDNTSFFMSGERNDNLIDQLQKNKVSQSMIKEIWMISGPAPFTSLRNISVIANSLSHFSPHSVDLFSIPSGVFLSLLFPQADTLALSAGKHEVFVFDQHNHNKYKKQKKRPGEIDPLNIETISPEQKQKAWEKLFLHASQYKTHTIIPDYGSLPNIG